MKTVIEEHYVPERRYTTTKYIASDGKEFSTEDACLQHEEYLEVHSHPVFKNRIPDVLTFNDEYCGSLYYFSNKDDYEFLVKHLGLKRNDSINSDYYDCGPGWYLYWCENWGDYQDHHYVRNYDSYVKEIETDLKEWKANIQERIYQANHV